MIEVSTLDGFVVKGPPVQECQLHVHPSKEINSGTRTYQEAKLGKIIPYKITNAVLCHLSR